MGVDRLTVCEWPERRRQDRVVSTPTWADVEAAIRALDGATHNDLYLYPSAHQAETYLCVGGGAGRYVVSGATRDGRFPTFTDQSRTELPQEPLVVGGQQGLYPAHWVVDLHAALRAARAFYEMGTFPAGVEWVDV